MMFMCVTLLARSNIWATRALSGQATMLNNIHISPSGSLVRAWEATIFPRFFTHFPRSLFHQIETCSNLCSPAKSPIVVLDETLPWLLYLSFPIHEQKQNMQLQKSHAGQQTRRRRRKDFELQWQNGYSNQQLIQTDQRSRNGGALYGHLENPTKPLLFLLLLLLFLHHHHPLATAKAIVCL